MNGALLRALDGDCDPEVRFVAAQALIAGHRDSTSFPSVARFIGDMVTVGTRDALDPALGAVAQVATFVGHARLGFCPAPRRSDLAPVRVVVVDALALAERLRSRHRRPLAGWLAEIDGTRGVPGVARPAAWAELEAPIPADLLGAGSDVDSRSGTDWANAGLNRALRTLGVRPRDTVVVTGMGGHGANVMMATLYSIADRSAAELALAFESVIAKPVRQPWEVRRIGGGEVRWLVGRLWTAASWARDGLVVHVAGDERRVERAIERLP